MRPILVFASAVFLGFLLLPSRAQQPAPKGAQAKAAPKADSKDEAPLVFKTGSRLVVVDVTVKDKAGHTIDGLKLSDFSVSEDGQKQKVEVFEPQTLTMEPEPAPELKLSDE